MKMIFNHLGRKVNVKPIVIGLNYLTIQQRHTFVKYLNTSANLRFSGLTLTLREIDSNTSAVLEFSLLTLTKNYMKTVTKLLSAII